jgi:hypothetical protein
LVSWTTRTASSGLFKWSRFRRTTLSRSCAISYAFTASWYFPSASLALTCHSTKKVTNPCKHARKCWDST